MHIRKMQDNDWSSVAEIYTSGIATGIATFETEIPAFDDWTKAHLESCRFIAEKGNKVCGWVALSPVSGRCVYGGVAEVSVYVQDNCRGEGIGKALMEKLIEASEKAGLWTLQSGIFPENLASIKLHEQVGFRYIGKREKVGKLKGVWHDNLLFERRSSTVGID